ncbi:iron-containing alcohol dehydrogenase [Nocardioides psychrotolerans]|uniref:Glycerol-1-phosphate dehydrogenase [NAD(P)+] n=1 Tax=Nocardioides psychrotolerans TaxID=1005945 RepID=A0A1I3HM14_9ACTN|nr:iron-containing alcohol dehydrogenase [Nocardioides psychrotolerans]SFI36673.1 glycerol-1-phosphate dehydrogenase [NAD(P)+] [Nocardioides psychrotolerans]
MSASSEAMDTVHALIARHDPERELAPCGLRRLVLGHDVLDDVTGTVAELLELRAEPGTPVGGARPRVTLLVDRVTIRRGADDVKDLVERSLAEKFDVRREVLDDGHSELHVVDDVLDQATAACRAADAVVALGGGTISDIGKVAAQRANLAGRPPVLVSVQTAASVDGYTDDVSVLLRDGVKRTVPSRWPDAVVADAGTIADAPPVMNRAGFGEMTSMLTAPADWALAALVGTEQKFHEAPLRLLEAVGEGIETWSPGVGRGEPEAIEQLTRALAVRGIVTGVAGTTATLSGLEHLVSHMLDLHHAAHGLPTGLHGAQVGVAGLVAASAWEMLHERIAASTVPPRLCEEAFDASRARVAVTEAFGSLDPEGRIAKECWADYEVKLASVAANRGRVEAMLTTWSDHAPRLRSLVRPSSELAASLRAARASAMFAELDPAVSDDLAAWAVANCGLMRNRFTVADLLTLLGWWEPADVAEVLDRARSAAGSARAAEVEA